MDFWGSALQAAKDAASKAKEIGRKGLEVVEATAEEANRKLNLNLHDKVGAGGHGAAPPPPEELAAFGLTPAFAEYVRTLNYAAFRDFPADHLLPVGDGSTHYQLNAWQVRHATLVVQALKEVNELRFVLCPKYMSDEHFWHVYFTLTRKHLPNIAYIWGPDDVLPTFGEPAADDAFSLSSLGTQLRSLSSKLQSASTSGRQRAGLELSNLMSSSRGGSASPPPAATGAGAAGGTAAAAATVAAAEPRGPAPGMLEEDPDLEAYLQVAISASAPGSDAGGSSGVEHLSDEDLDLDSYINELSAEVEAAAAAEGGGGDADATAAGADAAAAGAEAADAAAEPADADAAGGKSAKKD